MVEGINNTGRSCRYHACVCGDYCAEWVSRMVRLSGFEIIFLLEKNSTKPQSLFNACVKLFSNFSAAWMFIDGH